VRADTLTYALARMASSPSRTVRLGLIGCGEVAQRGYLPALSRVGGVALVAVADPVAGRRVLPDAAGYPDAAQMLASEQLDGVLVCSPAELHLEHARACAWSQLRALVEKPPGVTAAEAVALAKLRPEPVIGFNRRFARARQLRRRRLGEPVRITAVFDAPSGDWRPGLEPPVALIDLGCHLVDLCLWITGSSPAMARSMACPPERAAFELQLTNGARVYAECGDASTYRELLEIRDSRGKVASWSWPESAISQLGARVAGRQPGLLGSWRAQLEEFVALIRGDAAPSLARASQGVPVMAALEATRRSAADGGRWVTVESVLDSLADSPDGRASRGGPDARGG
jgi:predicted dehydrogenase